MRVPTPRRTEAGLLKLENNHSVEGGTGNGIARCGVMHIYFVNPRFLGLILPELKWVRDTTSILPPRNWNAGYYGLPLAAFKSNISNHEKE